MRLILFALLTSLVWPVKAGTDVFLRDTPDYDWYAGCFGTASGNLAGYWDRNGFPNMYSGPTGQGLAPMNSFGDNIGIRSLWASKAGVDGRPTGLPGHMDDYWEDYESTQPDPFVLANRAEHTPDCIGDFIGLSQNKWTNLNSECRGNIDAYSFVYWDTSGARRTNFQPRATGGEKIPDIPSGLREWTHWRGYETEVVSQLTDFNPTVPFGRGFTYEDLKAEIDAGYPVLLFLQPFQQLARTLAGTPNVNPAIHGMLAYGYFSDPESGIDQGVRYRTSWAYGDNAGFAAWTRGAWEANLPVRGVILYHPRPQITSVTRSNSVVHLRWDGPSARLHDNTTGTDQALHRYILERATTLNPANFQPVGEASEAREISLPDCCGSTAFYRVRLINP